MENKSKEMFQLAIKNVLDSEKGEVIKEINKSILNEACQGNFWINIEFPIQYLSEHSVDKEFLEFYYHHYLNYIVSVEQDDIDGIVRMKISWINEY